MSTNPDLVRGTLNTLLLEVISHRPRYGYDICKAVNVQTQGYFDLREGSLYPALHKLERDGLLKAYWEKTDAGRRRKYYEISQKGLTEIQRRKQEWQSFSLAVERVLLGGATGPGNEAIGAV